MKKWIRKKDLTHNHFDVHRWDQIFLNMGDIIISTYPKSGTTREQMTFLQLIRGPLEGINVTELSPYVDLCIESVEGVIDRIAEQKEYRRVLKSHLPLEYLPYNKEVDYIDVWRHPLDLAVSLFHHHNNANNAMFVAINENRSKNTEEFLPNTLSLKEWIARWVDQDGYPYWSYSKHINSTCKFKHLKNVHLFHYGDLAKNGLLFEIRKRMNILGLDFKGKKLEEIVDLCSFIKMKEQARTSAPYGGVIWGKGKGEEFFRNGKSGEWREIFTEQEASRFLDILIKRIDEGAARYLIQ